MFNLYLNFSVLGFNGQVKLVNRVQPVSQANFRETGNRQVELGWQEFLSIQIINSGYILTDYSKRVFQLLRISLFVKRRTMPSFYEVRETAGRSKCCDTRLVKTFFGGAVKAFAGRYPLVKFAFPSCFHS